MVPGLFVTRAGSEHLAGLAANAATLGSGGAMCYRLKRYRKS